MKTHQDTFPIATMGELLGVSRAGFYAMDRCGTGPRAEENAELAQAITRIYQENRDLYGSPRVHLALLKEGWTCGVNRVARIMREEELRGVQSRRKRVKTTDSEHSHAASPNLVKGLVLTAPDQAWAGDITYIRVGKRWIYLAAVIDLYSRKIVGWALAETLHATLVMEAMQQALETRDWNSGLIFHSDRGIQYACRDFRGLLKDKGLVQSMSARGNCYDNATMESFFGTLKAEEVGTYPNAESARRAIFDYVETFYNRTRIHTSLSGHSPEEFERQHEEAVNQGLKPSASGEFLEGWEAPLVGDGEGSATPEGIADPNDQRSLSPKYSLEGCSPAEPSSASPEPN
jgi:transposase InsO family protein